MARPCAVTFATHVRGMDMASFALDTIVLGDVATQQYWASDTREQARTCCKQIKNTPAIIYRGTRDKPRPGLPLMLYIAGPMSALGEGAERAR